MRYDRAAHDICHNPTTATTLVNPVLQSETMGNKPREAKDNTLATIADLSLSICEIDPNKKGCSMRKRDILKITCTLKPKY